MVLVDRCARAVGAKQTDPNPIIDPSYVKKIEQSGFITSLYKK
jgi:hypothetical protein